MRELRALLYNAREAEGLMKALAWVYLLVKYRAAVVYGVRRGWINYGVAPLIPEAWSGAIMRALDTQRRLYDMMGTMSVYEQSRHGEDGW